ncbi:hypothetical protein HDU93_004524 [Gonapodya sp. JEL0774]|nr:hypothetical protein HDU93_004524 [Gonapodya sp. JEL0774]
MPSEQTSTCSLDPIKSILGAELKDDAEEETLYGSFSELVGSVVDLDKVQSPSRILVPDIGGKPQNLFSLVSDSFPPLPLSPDARPRPSKLGRGQPSRSPRHHKRKPTMKLKRAMSVLSLSPQRVAVAHANRFAVLEDGDVMNEVNTK